MDDRGGQPPLQLAPAPSVEPARAEAARALLTVDEAADFLRVSRRSFMRHVRPHVPAVRVGRRAVYLKEDLLTWAVTQRGSSSSRPPRPAESGTAASPSVATASSSRRASEI